MQPFQIPLLTPGYFSYSEDNDESEYCPSLEDCIYRYEHPEFTTVDKYPTELKIKIIYLKFVQSCVNVCEKFINSIVWVFLSNEQKEKMYRITQILKQKSRNFRNERFFPLDDPAGNTVNSPLSTGVRRYANGVSPEQYREFLQSSAAARFYRECSDPLAARFRVHTEFINDTLPT